MTKRIKFEVVARNAELPAWMIVLTYLPIFPRLALTAGDIFTHPCPVSKEKTFVRNLFMLIPLAERR
jgi:hypothetical protein